ncbi:hypothetical protein LJB81_01555 [Desulfovibrio sp. OttesenSCG-928-M14]|nr:hypothetical protein [Desulfovibrio sp. OttesenSCG-928-M14]
MQKRFCDCGHMVLVNYRCERGIWKPQVLLQSRARQKSVKNTCPICGSPLNIHTLR